MAAQSPERANGHMTRPRRFLGWLVGGLGWNEPLHHHKKTDRATVRFHTRVAVLIACVSMVGAVAAWRASIHANQASEFDQQEMQERALKAQLDLRFAAIANEDSRLVPLYQSELANSMWLHYEADQVSKTSPRLAAQLDAEALEQLREAETTRQFMSGWVAESYTDLAQIKAQSDQEIKLLERFSDDYTRLQPDVTHRLAEDEHGTTQSLVEIVGILIGALVFLTLAHLADNHRRRSFVIVGSATAAMGVVTLMLMDPSSVSFVVVIAAAFIVANTLVIRRSVKAA